MDQDNKQKDRYFVAIKVFLEKNGSFLILKDSFGHWDLPGGRIKRNEFEKPLDQVLKRKMGEEVGRDVQYEIEPLPRILMRHKRNEPVGDEPEARIFALGYVGTWRSGDITLSPAHTEMKWAEVRDFVAEDFFEGGWLDGVRQYIELRR